MMEAYRNSDQFMNFVDKYRKSNSYTLEEALTHELVRLYYLEVKDGEDGSEKHNDDEESAIYSEVHFSI